MGAAIAADTFRALIDMVGRINACVSDTRALQGAILKSAMQLAECASARLFVLDAGMRTLRLAASAEKDGAVLEGRPVEQNGVAGWVLANNELLIVDKRSQPVLAVPMRYDGSCTGVIELFNEGGGRRFSRSDAESVQLLAVQAGIAYHNATAYCNAQRAVSLAHAALSARTGFHVFAAGSPAVTDLLHVIDDLARARGAVLITGEAGVGKELFAEQIHLRGENPDAPFVRVDCAALRSQSDADVFAKRFYAAHGGTLFLDEVSALTPALQQSLLDAMQDVGISSGVQVLSATRRNMEQLVADGIFLRNLYYRLNVLPLNIPPLRKRREDIILLAEYFLSEYGSRTKKCFAGFTQEAAVALAEYHWPGNARELKNAVERACMFAEPPYIQAHDLQLSSAALKEQAAVEGGAGADRCLRSAVNRFKRAYLLKILEENSWNQTKAARVLGIQRTYVARLLNELHIREDRQKI